SGCNKDCSCLKGFCPSFVTVHGAKPKRATATSATRAFTPVFDGLCAPADLPAPKLPAIDQTYGIIVTGIGGTGIVTVGAILGMAAHLDGKGVGVLDMAGLAQKGGAVYSHIRIAEKPEDIHAIRVAARGADLVLGGDIVVAGTKKVLAAVEPGVTTMVVNRAEVLPGEFTRNADFSLPGGRQRDRCAPAVANLRRDAGAPGRLSDRLSGRRLCRALPRLGREGPGGRGRARAGQMRACGGSCPQSLQADGLQRRVRGGAAL